MKRVLAVLLGATPLAMIAATPADYAYVFPIRTPATEPGSSAWRVELTPEVYRWVQDSGLRDIAIFNADQRAVPFARIVHAPAATVREQRATLPVLELPASVKSARTSDLRLVIDRDADGRLRRIDAGEQLPSATTTRDWLLDASRIEHAIDRVVLSWREPEAGVVARFAIDASDDLEHWRHVGGGTVLALEQQGARLEQREIAVGARANYFRLRRLDDGDAIAGLAVEARSTEHEYSAPRREWIDAGIDVSDAGPAPPGVTRFDYSLPAALPVDTARIELANDNALARLTVFARSAEAAAPWTRIADLTAFRLRQGDETLRNGDVDVRVAQRLRAFRIESAAPLAEAPRLSVGYRPESLVFLAEGSGPYVLAAGSATARHADDPIEPALASLRATLGKDWQPPLATLAAARASGGDTALRVPPTPVPWRRWLLWAILAGGAALIVVLALSLLREAKRPK